MNRTILNITAICDKAGRSVNQDNFWICPDLTTYETTGKVAIESSETDVVLTKKGSLLVVADGMGGMSAGEVASQLVIDSIKRTFSDLSSVDLSNADAVKRFIEQAIVVADEEMKQHANTHPETVGMGSTIVLVWLLDETAYVGWCGDSRAYCYNAQNGLVRLTHDHSYVQELVDKGLLSEEDAFDHPNSNIITRSLGDSGEEVVPETKAYPLHTGDTFLLCSDGLCGLLQDQEIAHTMAQNAQSVRDCLNALWRKGATIGWTDNTTIELAKIVEGGIAPTEEPVGYEVPKAIITPKPQSALNATVDSPTQPAPIVVTQTRTRRMPFRYMVIAIVAALLIGLVLGAIVVRKIFPANPKSPDQELVVKNGATPFRPEDPQSISTTDTCSNAVVKSTEATTTNKQQEVSKAANASSTKQVVADTVKTEATAAPQNPATPERPDTVSQVPAGESVSTEQGSLTSEVDRGGLTPIGAESDDSEGEI